MAIRTDGGEDDPPRPSVSEPLEMEDGVEGAAMENRRLDFQWARIPRVDADRVLIDPRAPGLEPHVSPVRQDGGDSRCRTVGANVDP